MPFAIGSPARRHPWIPDIAVFPRRPPITVIVQIFHSNQVPRTITRGTRVIVAALSCVRPVVKLIRVADLLQLRAQLRGTAKRHALSRMDGVFLPVPGRGSFSFPNRYDCVVAILGSFNPVPPGLKRSQRLVGSVDLKDVVPVQSTHAHVHRARSQLDLHGAIVKIQERKTSIGCQVNGGGTQFHHRSRIAVRPQPIARCYGTVLYRLHPL